MGSARGRGPGRGGASEDACAATVRQSSRQAAAGGEETSFLIIVVILSIASQNGSNHYCGALSARRYAFQALTKRVLLGIRDARHAAWNIDIVYAVVLRMKDKFDVGTAFPPVLERLLDSFRVCPPADRPVWRRAIEDFLEAEHTGVKATMIANYRKTIARALVPPMLEINVEEYGLKMRLHAERAARATLPDERDPFRWYPWKTGTSPYTSFH